MYIIGKFYFISIIHIRILAITKYKQKISADYEVKCWF